VRQREHTGKRPNSPRPKRAESNPFCAGDDLDTPVESFVRAMAGELGLDGDTPADYRTRRQLLRLSLWATGEGLALDREVILDPSTVERFAEVALASDRSRATYRAVLRRVGPLLTMRAPWEPRPASLARRQVSPPYTAQEVLLLRKDAFGQPTAARRTAARALLALGLGTGLDGRWVTRVAARDVYVSASAVMVEVGEPMPRRVVARADWEEELVALTENAGDQFLVGGYSTSTRRTGHLTERLVAPTGHPRLAPARLRSTWLFTHLRAGTRLPELCRAAGLEGVTVLSDLLELVDPLDEASALAMLRGTPG
jgi:hypothetical protein